MRKLGMVTMGFLILSGTGLAMADEAVLSNNTMVKPDVVTDHTDVNANANMGNDRVAVNDSDSMEVHQAAVRVNDDKIRTVRKDLQRDSQKLTDDTARLADAQSRNAADETARANADIETDKSALHEDADHLKARLADKIESDKAIIRKYDERIRGTRKDADRDAQKLTDDQAKLADAQSRNAADDITKANSDIADDKTAASADSAKLEKHTADKAECVAELKRDRRHLDAVVKRLSDGGQISADVYSDTDTEAGS